MKKITSTQLNSLYRNMTVNSAARYIGVSRQHFYRILRNNNIPLKGRQRKVVVE